MPCFVIVHTFIKVSREVSFQGKLNRNLLQIRLTSGVEVLGSRQSTYTLTEVESYLWRSNNEYLPLYIRHQQFKHVDIFVHKIFIANWYNTV